MGFCGKLKINNKAENNDKGGDAIERVAIAISLWVR